MTPEQRAEDAQQRAERIKRYELIEG